MYISTRQHVCLKQTFHMWKIWSKLMQVGGCYCNMFQGPSFIQIQCTDKIYHFWSPAKCNWILDKSLKTGSVGKEYDNSATVWREITTNDTYTECLQRFLSRVMRCFAWPTNWWASCFENTVNDIRNLLLLPRAECKQCHPDKTVMATFWNRAQ